MSSDALVKQNLNLSVLKKCLEDCKKQHGKYPENPAIKDIESKLSQLEKLEESLTGLTKEENCKDLLENLCDGLQTFLGFNSASKGYDGSGIVYSDLDRLCDAVMGFLYQVLKDVSEKQPYNVGKNRLNEAMEKIKSARWKGHGGLNDIIAYVVSRVSSYNTNVVSYNGRVKKPINELLGHVQNDIPKEIKIIPEDKELEQLGNDVERKIRPTEELAKTYVKYGKSFAISMSKISEQIRTLNSDLRVKIDQASKNIKHETKRLEDVSSKEEHHMKVIEKHIKELLTNCNSCVNDKICKDVAEFVKLLKDKVSKIRQKLDEIDRNLYKYVKDLQEWIDKADKIVKRGIFETEDIEKKGIGKDKQDKLKAVAKALNDRGIVLLNYINDMKKQIAENVKAALTQVKEMDGKLKEDLYKVKKAIEAQVAKIKEAIGKLYDVVKNGQPDEGTNDQTIAGVIGEIHSKVKNFTGNKGGRTAATDGLTGIISGVRWKYAKNFETRFTKAISDIVTGIVESEGVKQLLRSHIDGNSGYLDDSKVNGKNTDAKIMKLGSIIVQHLTSDLNTLPSPKSELGTKDNVDGNMSDISSYLTSYATQVTSRHSVVAKLIGDHIKNANNATHYNNYYLERVVGTVFAALHKATAKAGEELTQFITLSQISKLKPALDAGELLQGHLNAATTNKKPAKLVDDAISEMSNVATNHIGKDTLAGVGNSGDRISSLGEQAFVEYKKYVSQESLPLLDNNIDNLGGTLTAAIKKIRDDASPHDVTPTKNDLEKWSGEITSNLESLLTSVSEKGKAVSNHLRDLQKQISKGDDSNGLQDIQKRLSYLQKAIEGGPLKLADDFLKGVDPSRNKYVKQLQQFVDSEITTVKNRITSEVRKHYISTIRELLTDYAQKVQSELNKLPEEIDDDLRRGYKGFVKKMETHLLPELTIPPNTPLKDAASTLKSKLTAFMEQLQNQADFKKSFETVKPSHTAILELLQQLNDSKHFGHLVPPRVNALLDRLGELSPKKYKEEAQPMLDTLKVGYGAFCTELGKAYVSRYSGQTVEWTETGLSTGLTQNAHRCAKIFLTAFSTIYDAVHDLRINCNSLKGHQIHSTSDLGRLFLRHGFRVSDGDKQHWELQNKDVINGEYVLKRISFRVDGAKDNEHLKECESNKRKSNVLFNLFDILKCILYHIDKYNETCHIAILPKPRTPCTVFEMLVWLSGLTYTSAYQALLSDGFTNVLDNPDTPLAGDGEITVFDIEKSYLEAHPQKITYKNICKVLDYLCSKSYDLLTTVVGHGNAATFYACDYSNNTLNLYYPSSGEDCLQMLLDFLRRILQPLRYLFERCSVADKNYGWADCHYGKDVPTTKSHCNIKPTDEAACLPNCQPNCEPNCQPTSPLMNYLSDSLLGYLPHRLESVGCKSKCSTCPSTSRLGMPCVTPLGFRAFSGSTKTGRQLCEMIREFLGSGVISSLLGLSPTPPKTLPEHFGFGLSLVNKWVKVASYITDAGIKPVSQSKIEASIQKLSIKLYTDTGKLTNVLRDAYGNSQHEHEGVNHLEVYADVSSLCMTRSCEDSHMRCAPYLSTLCSDTYQYLVHKNFATYLTWAVYLPWDFWTQLNNLCNAFKNIFCQDWGCHTCLRADKCKRGQHGLVEKVDKQPDKPHCKCPSMVQCKGVSATLYQFGFSFGNAATLNDTTSAKKCSDFCSQLDKVLKSEYFKKLFTECDNFIWTIREPFTYLVLALWSLSLFYLICVMVGRLDVLHIRSHLRIPSSHRITAQSLLAAAQVGRLAKISYLQP
ncbi:hypothetical protein, conserved [Babesia bigemina]|uniref:C3H1-type domain-containing protein n=1 Tax=Babesia bigemina TaxID=5866 RepID=A0A061BJB5_BABBI|nr:hypothetical protein, conserved [Babesia bigemina]CDR71584.1 hypothetical protein, conserved [Babesia bigemina]|eukprot:XP_012770530.1 hypothetical protein, conserved [Babesia bigemina]